MLFSSESVTYPGACAVQSRGLFSWSPSSGLRGRVCTYFPSLCGTRGPLARNPGSPAACRPDRRKERAALGWSAALCSRLVLSFLQEGLPSRRTWGFTECLSPSAGTVLWCHVCSREAFPHISETRQAELVPPGWRLVGLWPADGAGGPGAAQHGRGCSFHARALCLPPGGPPTAARPPRHTGCTFLISV